MTLPHSHPGPANQHDPWSVANHPSSGQKRPDRGGTKTLLIVLGSIGLALLLGCLGLLGLGYQALNRFAGGGAPAPMQQRPPSFDEDLNRFNQLLAAYSAAPLEQPPEATTVPDQSAATHPLQSELTQWFERSVRDYHESGTSISVSAAMFLQAARNSHLATELPFAGRLAMKISVDEYFPEPDLEIYQTVLGIDFDPTYPLATIHFLSYDGWSMPYSLQWFLVKDNDQWKLYDWQRLDYGRRTSDEYGGYFSSIWHPHSDGFDESLTAMNKLIADYHEAGELTLANRATAKALESKPMLLQDRSVAFLHMAWTWQHLGEQTEALRVLAKIPARKLRLGVLPTRIYASLASQDINQAVEAADQFQALSPHHPALADARGDILLDQGKTSEAADSYLQALRICPQWESVESAVVRNAKPHHVSQLVAIASQSGSPIEHVTDWAESWMDRPSLIKELIQEVEQATWDSTGFTQLARGLRAYYRDDYLLATQQLLQARQIAREDAVEAAATRWLETNRLEAGQFADWISESEDLPRSLASLALKILQNELVVDKPVLRDVMLEVSRDSDAYPYARLLVTLTELDKSPADAVEGLNQFMTDAKQLGQEVVSEDSDENNLEDLVDAVRSEKIATMLRLNRVMTSRSQK